ncbi:MAG TPA: lysylphosphatidylglycerol synthase transmembrane domain-containing protein, partial [Pseudonocardia sp.]|nr:lysylphosphatidylglycerol synthase transmembrane domain-containing protein [Pseudonocardia sp.]
MKHSLPTRPTPWLRLLVGIGIIIGLVALLGGDAFANGLAVIGPASIAAALAIGLLTTVLGALRWWLVARRVGLQLRVRDAIAEVYRATFLNAVLPSGVLGDVDRAVRHGRDSGDTARSARAVVLERTAGQVVLIGVACIVLPTQPALVAAVL